MSDDELLAIYGSIRRLAESMDAREAALETSTAALHASIAQLQQLPFQLGKQTSQYIGMGVREAVHDDLTLPIEAAIKGPLAEMSSATYNARDVMRQVSTAARFQGWAWLAGMVLLGVVLGSSGSYWFFVRDLGRLNDRMDAMQQTAPAATAESPTLVQPKKKRGLR